MRKGFVFLTGFLFASLMVFAQQPPQGNRRYPLRENIPLDSIVLSDPAILADQKTRMYYMTGTGRLGMIWTSWVFDIYMQGVAYSESGTLDGPWIHEEKPITPPNFGHGMLFQTFDGKWLMSVHSHENRNGRYHRIPSLFEVDLSGDRLVVGERYR